MNTVVAAPLDFKREIKALWQAQKRFDNSEYKHESKNGFQSSFFDEYIVQHNQYGNLRTADRRSNREIDPRTLRRVAKKAWIINICIKHIQNAITPYLKPSTNRNLRGFVVHKIGEDIAKAAGRKSDERTGIEQFIKNCGNDKDSNRDSFQRFCMKIVRDSMVLDYCATEIGYTRAGKPYAFWAIDAGTIEQVLPGQNNPFDIRYVQLIQQIPKAYYPEGTLIVDYQNPRSDVEHSFYGFSLVEQAIDLVTSTINSFAYNAGFFTENKLPRGLLLIDGNMNQENVEQMEDYICDVMSGSPVNQWRIPIVPSGNKENGIKWQPLGSTNKEMEFQGWIDFLTSAIVSLFGCSMEELGLHSSKSQPMFEHNDAPKIESSKSSILGTTLTFLQSYINRILEKFFPEYEFEFVGYERDDPKQILDLDKGEVESYKTLNEKRKEKGLEPLGYDFANIPLNPQAVQAFQSAQAQEQGSGMEDVDDGGETEGADFGEEADGIEEDSAETNVDEDAWSGVDDGGQNEIMGKPQEMGKSIASTKMLVFNL